MEKGIREELLKITNEEFTIFEKISKLLAKVGDLYICQEITCINWVGRDVFPGELISENTYKNSQDFNKRCLRKLTLSEIVSIMETTPDIY